MKFPICFAILIFTTNLNFSQNNEWFQYAIQDFTIEFPTKEIDEEEILSEDYLIKKFSTLQGNTSLSVSVLSFKEETLDQTDDLPYNYDSLIKYYCDFIIGYNKDINAEVSHKKVVKNKGIIGYSWDLLDLKDNLNISALVYLINSKIYILLLESNTLINSELKDHFFNSFGLEDDNNANQYVGKSSATKLGYTIGGIIVPLLFVLIFWLINRKYINRIIRRDNNLTKQDK